MRLSLPPTKRVLNSFCLRSIALFFMMLQSWMLSAEQTACVTQTGNGHRIVSIGGSITEILYALDCAEGIIAVDSTSLFPDSALREHENIGYLRTIAAEPIIAMQPDLVIADQEAEPQKQLQLISNSGIQVEKISAEHGIDAIYSKIRRIASILSVEERGEVLSESIQSRLESLKEKVSSSASNRRVLFLLSIDAGPIMASGGNTAADSMITLAGGNNVFDSFSGYKPISAESILKADPELILLPSHVVDSHEAALKILARPEFRLTRAARDNNVQIIDSLYVLGFGPRTPEALNELYSMME